MRFVVDISVRKLFAEHRSLRGTEILFFSEASVFRNMDWNQVKFSAAQIESLSDLSKVLDLISLTPFTSKTSVPPHEVCTDQSSISLIQIGEKYALDKPRWPRQLMPGDREVGYKTTVQPLAKLAREIEIIDPYIATMMVKNPRQLWLLNRLMEDCDGTIRIITQEEKETRFLPEKTQRDIYQMEFENFLDFTDNPSCDHIEVRINKFSKDFHNRSIRFLFENGASSDHELAHGVDAFSSKITDSDLARMSPEAYSARRARNLNTQRKMQLSKNFV